MYYSSTYRQSHFELGTEECIFVEIIDRGNSKRENIEIRLGHRIRVALQIS